MSWDRLATVVESAMMEDLATSSDLEALSALRSRMEQLERLIRDAYRQGYEDSQHGVPSRPQDIDLTPRALGETP